MELANPVAKTTPVFSGLYLQMHYPEYLFDPVASAQKLTDLIHLKTPIRRLISRSTASSLPGVLKSEAEIANVLNWDTLDSPASLLRFLDSAVGLNFYPAKGLLVPRQKFYERFAEAELMMDMYSRGLTVTPLDVSKGHSKVCDAIVSSGSFNANIEVYCPYDWEATTSFNEELRDHLRFIDRAESYSLSIHLDLITHFVNGDLVNFNPFEFGKLLPTAEERWKVVEPVINLVNCLLDERKFQLMVHLKYQALNLKVGVSVWPRESHGLIPTRGSTMLPPSLSGLWPPGILQNFLVGKLYGKDGKQQYRHGMAGSIGGIVVNMANLKFAQYFSSGPFDLEMVEVIRRTYRDSPPLADFVAFATFRSSDSFEMKYPAVYCTERISDEDARSLFGSDCTIVR